MAKLKNRLKRYLPTQRRLIQLYAALLYNAHLKGFITGNIYTGKIKALCVPGFNCYSCPGAIGACPLGALQNALAASGNRAPTYVLGILLLFGLTLGRTICGFLCPVGLMQDLLHKLPTPKLSKSRVTRVLSFTKYALLALFVVILPLWYSLQSLPLPAFCKYICPAGTLEGAVGLLSHPANADKFSMLGILFTRKFIILLLILAACVFIYRAFCRFLCPLGAIYGLFARVAVIGVKVDVSRCTDCGRCVSRCPMDINRVGDHECIHCGKCMNDCPEQAIFFQAGRITLHSPEIAASAPNVRRKYRTRRIIAWAAALLVLLVAFWYVNLYAPGTQSPADGIASPSATEAPADDSIPTGKEIGMRAPDFTVPLYGRDASFSLSSSRGKITIVNFWATWCTPCCNELPFFDAVARQYGDSVCVIAIHSSLVTDNVEGYLARFDYLMPFALDESGTVIQSFGGSTMLPQTVVIDENGIITYNAVGSVTLEKLESLIAQAAQ